MELIEKSCLSFLADADLIRPLLASKDCKPSRVDELSARLADAEKQAAKLAKLILGDDEPSPTIYSRLKQEEARVKKLRAEIDEERMRERSEKPALVAYNEFRSTLPELLADKTRRPELRRAVASVVEKIRLDPHGENGRYVYEVELRGGQSPVTVSAIVKLGGWLFESKRSGVQPNDGDGVVRAAA